MTSSSQEGSNNKNGIDQKQEDMSDSIEWEDWGTIILIYDDLFSFPSFVTSLVRPGLVVKPRV
jgi:hypothetical protein